MPEREEEVDDISVWISMSYPVLSLSVLFDFSKKGSSSGLLELEESSDDDVSVRISFSCSAWLSSFELSLSSLS